MSPVRFAGGGTLKTTGGKLGNVVNGTFQQKWPLSNTINFSNLWNAPQPDGVDPKVAANPTLQAIKDKPMPTWVGNFKSTVQAEVDLVTSYIAQTAGKTSIWVTYGVPNRDLGNYSGGGFTSRAAYIDWVTRIRDALGTAPVVIISEPDALGQSRQISDATQKADRIENLRQANTILAAAPNSKVYIDAAHWVPAAEQAALLQSVNVAACAGFSINVSNFVAQDTLYAYGDSVVAELVKLGITGKKYVIDSGRNGNGELTSAFGSAATPWISANQTWCNPPGRKMGLSPGPVTGHSNCDASLWIKGPGGSDGPFPTTAQSNYYGESAPAAGVFWTKWALDFVANSNTTTGTPRLTMNTSGVIQKSGATFRTGGANIFQIVHNDYPSSRLMSHAEIDSLFDKCVSMGIGIVRAHTLGVNIGSSANHLVTGVSGTGTNPTIQYNTAVWEVMDYAISSAKQRGVYLMVPMTDELGYYHGGKRQWVNFRRPGTCSTDGNVKSANSSTERTAENYFFTDTQIKNDYKQFISDWLNHTNQYTGLQYKNDPTVAVLETANEIWTADDFRTWTPEIAGWIKSIAPNVLVADGMAADGSGYWASLTPAQDPIDHIITAEALASPYVDIHGIHPYSVFTAADITKAAAKCAAAGKAFATGEYPWSKSTADGIEQATRNAPNAFFSAFWSLQNDSDAHNGGSGAGYGTDDASLYYPGRDATQSAAVTRLISHAQALAGGTVTPTPTTTTATSLVSSDTFTGTNGAAPSTTNWSVFTQNTSTANIQNNALRFTAAALGGYGDKVVAVAKQVVVKDQLLSFSFTPLDITKEFYFQIAARAQTSNDSVADTSAYRVEVNKFGVVALTRRSAGVSTSIGSTYTIPGWASNTVVNMEFAVIGSTQSVKAWTGSTKPSNANISGTDTNITAAGTAGFVLGGGNTATSVSVDLDTFSAFTTSTMPTGNLTTANGTWNYTYGTDFDTAVSLGSFPGSYSSWFDTYDGFTDTSKRGTYSNAKTTSVSGGSLLVDMHTENGVRYVACPVVRATSGSSYSGQVYGRYSTRMRAVTVAGNPSGYKVAFMLWPTDDVWPAHGEYDFPETDLGTGSYAQANLHRATSAGGQDQFTVASTNKISDWHIYTIEWSPTRVECFLDGTSIGYSTSNISTFPMRWTLQCETDLANALDDTQRSRVEVDWIAQWSRA